MSNFSSTPPANKSSFDELWGGLISSPFHPSYARRLPSHGKQLSSSQTSATRAVLNQSAEQNKETSQSSPLSRSFSKSPSKSLPASISLKRCWISPDCDSRLAKSSSLEVTKRKLDFNESEQHSSPCKNQEKQKIQSQLTKCSKLSNENNGACLTVQDTFGSFFSEAKRKLELIVVDENSSPCKNQEQQDHQLTKCSKLSNENNGACSTVRDTFGSFFSETMKRKLKLSDTEEDVFSFYKDQELQAVQPQLTKCIKFSEENTDVCSLSQNLLGSFFSEKQTLKRKSDFGDVQEDFLSYQTKEQCKVEEEKALFLEPPMPTLKHHTFVPAPAKLSANTIYPDRAIPYRLTSENGALAQQFRQASDLSQLVYWEDDEEFVNLLAERLTGLNLGDLLKFSSLRGPVKLKKPEAVTRAVSKSRIPRIISTLAVDSPQLINDFYADILVLSKNNEMTLALGHKVYLQDTNKMVFLLATERSKVTSLCWLDLENLLAVGTETGSLSIIDTSIRDNIKLIWRTQLPTISPLYMSITKIVQLNNKQLAVASDDEIFLIDLNGPSHIATLKAHSKRLSGLALSSNGQYLASGGNGNIVNIWRTPLSLGSKPCYRFPHTAAVKALAWNPIDKRANLLATGAGMKDRRISLWNIANGKKLCEVFTGDSVNGLHWLPDGKHLISVHGVPGCKDGKIRMWRYSIKKGIHSSFEEKPTHTIGHAGRINYSALSSDGKLLVTAGADEATRYWNIVGGSACTPSDTKPSSFRFERTIR